MEVESFYGRWQFLKDKQRGPAKMIFEWRPEAGLQVHSEDTVRGALEGIMVYCLRVWTLLGCLCLNLGSATSWLCNFRQIP